MLKKKRNFFILAILTIIGATLHFYNLNWGAPFYFNPDERNIASAVSQMHFPQHMNPHFFAYGSLPIYVIYFTGFIANYFLSLLNSTPLPLNPTFEQAIQISRMYSAIFATLLIPLLFVIARSIAIRPAQENKKNDTAGLLAAFFATFSVGFIQFAHFGTFEMWLTFFGVLLFWNCLKLWQTGKKNYNILLSLISGILIATKISSFALLPVPFSVLLLSSLHDTRKSQGTNLRLSEIFKFRRLNLLNFLKNAIMFTFIASAVFIVTNPYAITDQKDFFSSMQYESRVALGSEPVFYTQNFNNTVSVIYQFLHIYPFLLNPLVTILFIPSFIFLLYFGLKKKSANFLLLISFFLLLFLSQAFLFVKWTRYMVPTIPFIYLIIALSVNEFIKRKLRFFIITVSIFLCSIFAVSYFYTVYGSEDTRIASLLFAQHSIPPDAHILTEPSDLGVMPFQDAFAGITTFDFYDLDVPSSDITEAQLQQKLVESHYIVLPSQRILQSRIENSGEFPKGYIFYKTLLNSSLGFHKIYETPCDIFCSITYLNDPISWWEQTASVFDHPTVFIFEKN